MVKMQAVQSALAIRRQRSRREDARRAQARRASGATPRPSVVSLDGKVYFDEEQENKKILGQMTMFHVGAVFIVIGLMLVTTSLMPGYLKTQNPDSRNNLLGTGCFCVFIGGVLTTISRFVSNNEEKELNKYIKRRLARSKSGHRLVRDAESGLPTPPRERRADTSKSEHAHQNGTAVVSCSETPSVSSPVTKVPNELQPLEENLVQQPPPIPPGGPHDGPITPSTSTEPVLSRILEEDECEVDASTDALDSTPESSVTPTSPLETQGLLEKHHSPRKGSKGSSKGSNKSLR
ncbi:uncharacterized protein LOC143037201 [Oratosquilla oratoria]|uniref:uncharacterized protein LOC143037201 n=1 Tax=Oratosquilla oratoria TaxID=337810 RepID=UPI003F766CA3